MLAVDVNARVELRELRAQLSGTADVNVIGRRNESQVNAHRTLRVKTLDRTNDYIWGRDYWNSGDLGDDRTEAFWDDSDSASVVVVQVINQDNEFRFFTEEIMNAFFDSANSTCSINTSSETINYSGTQVFQTESVALGDGNILSCRIEIPEDQFSDLSTFTFSATNNGSTWESVTDINALHTFTTTGDNLKIRINSTTGESIDLQDSQGKSSPLVIKYFK